MSSMISCPAFHSGLSPAPAEAVVLASPAWIGRIGPWLLVALRIQGASGGSWGSWGSRMLQSWQQTTLQGTLVSLVVWR